MIGPGARGLRDLEAKLRPFVARRVRSEADVDDVLQEVFLRIQRSVGGLRDDERFGPWVYRVTRSAIVDHHRAAAKHPLAADDRVEERPLEVDEDVGDVEQEVAGYVAAFVAALPSPYREALTLTELEGLAQKDAAEMLGVSLPAMKSRVQRGRAQLRAALESCCDFAVDARGRVVSCTPRPDGRPPEGCCS